MFMIDNKTDQKHFGICKGKNIINNCEFHQQNIDVQIVNNQYISKFTCMTLIYVLCATLISKVMNIITF